MGKSSLRALQQRMCVRWRQAPRLHIASLASGAAFVALLTCWQSRSPYSIFATHEGAWGEPRPELEGALQEEWRRRHEADVEYLRSLAAPLGPGCPLVLLGDSITEGWLRPALGRRAPGPPTCKLPCGPGSAVLPELGSAAVFAIGGDRIEDLAWRLFEAGGAAALRACKPETVSVLIGTNDFTRGQDVASAQAELLRFAAQLEASLAPGTRVVLQGLLPRATFAREKEESAATWDARNPEFAFARPFNEAVREHAEAAVQRGGSVSFLDCGAQLLRPAPGGSAGERSLLSREVFPDLLHLSEQGYGIWSRCLLGHLGGPGQGEPSNAGTPGPAAAPALPSGGSTSADLVARIAQVPPPGGQQEDPIEVLWQRPPGPVRAVVLLLHGCAHQGTDFWGPAHCPRCLGLPEEVRITRSVLARGMLPMAVTSMDRDSGCWHFEDIDRVDEAIAYVYRQEGLPESLPLYAFGASSGGSFLGPMAEKSRFARTSLRCRIPQIMSFPGRPSFSGQLPSGETVSWASPPTLFIHMPVDTRTAGKVKAALSELWAGGVVAAELRCEPQVITDDFFSARLDGMVTLEQSKALASILRRGGFLDSEGKLRSDPRASDEWREALMSTGVPQALNDPLAPDASAINEEMNLAFARHEMCATFVQEMLDFCEDPAGQSASWPP